MPQRDRKFTSTARSVPSDVEAGVVVDAEIMALAGHDHVVVPVEPHLGGAAGEARGQGGQRRPLRRLGFLAAEAAAHAAAFADHGGVGHRQHLGDAMLDFGRMLGRGIDQHPAGLLGHRQRDLAFQVEMLLAADAEGFAEQSRRTGEGGGDIAAQELIGRQDVHLGGDGVLDGDRRLLRLDLDDRVADGAAGLVAGGADHREHHLAVEVDAARRQDGIVALVRAAIIDARDIVGSQHGDDAIGGADRLQIQLHDPAAGGGGIAGHQMDRAGGLRHVVDIDGGALDMALGAVMGDGLAAHPAGGRRGGPRRALGLKRRRHGAPPAGR